MTNIANAKALLATVRRHREAFEMADWVRVAYHAPSNGSGVEKYFTLTLENIEEGKQECGTTLCLAGFAGLLAGRKVDIHMDGDYSGFSERQPTQEEEEGRGQSWSEIGGDYLEIGLLRHELFYTSNKKAAAMLIDLARGVPEDVILKSFFDDYYHTFEGLTLDEILDRG